MYEAWAAAYNVTDNTGNRLQVKVCTHWSIMITLEGLLQPRLRYERRQSKQRCTTNGETCGTSRWKYSFPTSNSQTQKSEKKLFRSIKKSNIKPFDAHFNLPLVSNEGHFSCRLSKIGFDMITCNSDTCPSSSRGESSAKSNNIVSSLLSAEKSKFQRGRGSNTSRTDSSSQITLTWEQIIGELFEDNMQLLPFAISRPVGLFGPTINYFLYGTTPPKDYRILHNIDKSKFPNASNMARQAFTRTSSNILGEVETTKLSL